MMANDDDKDAANLWYFSREGRVSGPFTAGMISRDLLLGRIRLADRVSMDGKNWLIVENVPELIPEVMKGDRDDPLFQQRLEAARRWADERRYVPADRQQAGDEFQPERRAPEPEEMIRHRAARYHMSAEVQASPWKSYGVYLAIAGLAAVVVSLVFYHFSDRGPTVSPDCSAVPAPAVVMNNCELAGEDLADSDLSASQMRNADLSAASLARSRLQRADLSFAVLVMASLEGADFSHAILKGANLRAARLVGASFRDADLSYADLTGAVIAGADFTGADLGKAKWIDGSLCAPGSIGRCEAVAVRP